MDGRTDGRAKDLATTTFACRLSSLFSIHSFHTNTMAGDEDVPAGGAGDDGADDNKKSGPPSKTYEERLEAVNVISHPLASKKSTKKAHKLVKRAAAAKHLRRGVKEVAKGLRKGETGLAVLAGDIYPIDVISHLPILLEEKNVPYLYVPSKQDLGAAASTKRPTSVVLIRTPDKSKDFDGQDLYDALVKEAKEFDPTSLGSR